MGKEVTAHIGFNLSAHDMTDGLHEIVGRRVDNPQHHVEGAQPQDYADAQSGDVGRAHIRDVAHDQGQHQIADGGQRRAEQIQQQYG